MIFDALGAIALGDAPTGADSQPDVFPAGGRILTRQQKASLFDVYMREFEIEKKRDANLAKAQAVLQAERDRQNEIYKTRVKNLRKARRVLRKARMQ